MPLVLMKAILDATEKYNYAQGAFNVNAVCQARAVIQVHEIFRFAAILQGADLANAFMGGHTDFAKGTLKSPAEKDNCVIICSSTCNGYFHDERWPYLRELYELFQHDHMNTLGDFINSMICVACGFGLGFVTSLPVSFLMAWYTPVRKITEPWINFIRNIPALAYAPLIVIAAGVGRTPAIILIWICAFFTVSFLASTVGAICGIGGGPINLVVLFYFFGMDTKTAAANSLYIILFSQLASVLSTVLTGTVPPFPWTALLLMAAGGSSGGIAGRVLNCRMDEKMVDKLFIGLMVVIIGICFYNGWQYSIQSGKAD